MKWIKTYESLDSGWKEVSETEADNYVRKLGRSIFSKDELNMIYDALNDINSSEIIHFCSSKQGTQTKYLSDRKLIDMLTMKIEFELESNVSIEIDKLNDDWFLIDVISYTFDEITGEVDFSKINNYIADEMEGVLNLLKKYTT